MRRRLYFILPNVETARQIDKELLLARIEDHPMHFLARGGADLGDLPQASLAQTSDIVHGMWTGMVAGGATGVMIGVLLSFSPPIREAVDFGKR